MQAEIITIGDEILIGQIVDTNSAWLAETLGDAGIRISRITSIGDSREEITETVSLALERSQIVITTGGLGPTKDDITKLTIAEMFGCRLVRHEPSHEHTRRMVEQRGMDFNELNQAQSLVPECCEAILNHNGTAPGMWFERGGSVLVSMPGVPFEMKEMTLGDILPRLKKHFSLNENIHKTALTYGLPESKLALTIASWEDALPGHLHLAYLPSALGIRLRLSAYETSDGSIVEEIDHRFAALEKMIPEYIVGYGETSLEKAIGEILAARGETVVTAESCTGGNIAHRITMNPRSSAYFPGGVVSYSNDLKRSLLNVSHLTLSQHGAVSREVAEQMAAGAREATGATYAISTTGIAGPDGGTKEKPVGTVWIALATPEGVTSQKFVLGNLRDVNIERASSNALNMLRLHLSTKK